MSSDATYDCFHDREAVAPYPDISGPGVLAGFIGTAYVSIFILVVYYIVSFLPENDSTCGLSEADTESGTTKSQDKTVRPNPVDQFIARSLSRWRRSSNDSPLMVESVLDGPDGKFRPPREHMRLAFERCITAMCDIQMLTGIGILSSGYYAAFTGHLSAYHWQVIVYLAWFSNLTQLSGHTFLRRRLQQHPMEKWCRVAMMTFLFLMLIVAMVPTGFFTFTISPLAAGGSRKPETNNTETSQELSFVNASTEARCLFNVPAAQIRLDTHYLATDRRDKPRLHETLAFSRMIISVLLATFSQLSRMSKLSQSLSTFVGHTLRQRLDNFWNKSVLRYVKLCLRKRKRPPSIKWAPPLTCQAFIACRVCVILYLDMFSSMAGEIVWLLISAVWGTMQLFQARNAAQVDEGGWTFGQILPIFLFVVPLLSLSLEIWPLMRTQRVGYSDLSTPAPSGTSEALVTSPTCEEAINCSVYGPLDRESAAALAVEQALEGLRQYQDRSVYVTQACIGFHMGCLALSMAMFCCAFLTGIGSNSPLLMGANLIHTVFLAGLSQVQLFFMSVWLGTAVSIHRWPFVLHDAAGAFNIFVRKTNERPNLLRLFDYFFVFVAAVFALFLWYVISSSMDQRTVVSVLWFCVFSILITLPIFLGIWMDYRGTPILIYYWEYFY